MSDLKRTPQLLRVVFKDLLRHRQQLLLLVLVLLSAMAVVWTTHHARLLVEERESLMIARDELNVEWRHRLLEHNSLKEHSRIETLAKQELAMARPLQQQQVVVTLNE